MNKIYRLELFLVLSVMEIGFPSKTMDEWAVCGAGAWADSGAPPN